MRVHEASALRPHTVTFSRLASVSTRALSSWLVSLRRRPGTAADAGKVSGAGNQGNVCLVGQHHRLSVTQNLTLRATPVLSFFQTDSWSIIRRPLVTAASMVLVAG